MKATLSTSGWCVRAPPAVGPYPGMTLTTPGGNPASLIKDAIARAVSGVCSAGFTMTVQPVDLKQKSWDLYKCLYVASQVCRIDK